MQNIVTIFSNGIADFRRVVKSKAEPQTLSLPVKKEHVGDLLATLTPLGPIKLLEPPSYEPDNDQHSLALNPAEIYTDMAVKLSGAKVRLIRLDGQNIEGRLAGLHSSESVVNNEIVKTNSIVVIDSGISIFTPLDKIAKLVFLDDEVKAEIAKALERNYQKIKPGSTFVTLKVQTINKAEDGVLQYALPAAAWKISYRLRDPGTGKLTLEGLAIVDNNTDEDWNDFALSVVTGDPITFSTDLAAVKTPHRQQVNFVADQAQGAVVVGREFASSHSHSRRAMTKSAMAFAACAAPAGGGLERSADYEADYEAEKLVGDVNYASLQSFNQSAFEANAEITEVGDYSVFSAKDPVTIASKKSALVPVFSLQLNDAKKVLHYKRANDAERAFRSILFTNESEFTLGRGPCTVVEKSIHQGEADFPASKPGEKSVVPYARDTTVRFLHQQGSMNQKRSSISTSDGVLNIKVVNTVDVTYRLINTREEAFLVNLDHDFVLGTEAKATAVLERTDDSNEEWENTFAEEVLKTGRRFEFTLPPKGNLTFTVKENQVVANEIKIGSYSTLVSYLSGTKLLDNPSVKKCAEIQEKIDEAGKKGEALETEHEKIDARQERLRKNLTAGGHDESTAEWKSELAKNEKRLQVIEDKEQPELQKEIDKLQKALKKALKEVEASLTE